MLCTKSMVLRSLTSQPLTPPTTRYVSLPGQNLGDGWRAPVLGAKPVARGPPRLRAGPGRPTRGRSLQDAGIARAATG